MWFLGIDIGSAYSKAAVCKDRELRSFAVMQSGGDYGETGRRLTELALEEAKISLKDITCSVATGYGSIAIDFATSTITDIACHAFGVHYLFPSVRTVIDVGAQFSRAIRINGEGKVAQFVMNEKCAGGSGKFLQVIARILHKRLEDIAGVSTAGSKGVEFTTGCAVFAESEAVSRISEGASPGDILSGVHKAMASKIANLVTRVGLTPECSITGGGARHIGLVEAVERELKMTISVPTEPQITAALGAALLAAKLKK